VNHALYQIGVFNQLVRQQTDFIAQHLHEIADGSLSTYRRRVLASAARSQSRMLHGVGIGNAGGAGGWFRYLTDEIDENIKWLNAKVQPPWWMQLMVGIALCVVTITAALAIWQGIDDDSDHALPTPTPITVTTTP
jgi:hypothetical protein